MKHLQRTLMALLMLAVATASALAQEPAAAPERSTFNETRQGFGLGVLAGEPMGLTAKFFINRHHALQVHMGWDFTDSAFDTILDYLYHIDAFTLDTTTLELPLYVGGGLKLGQEVGQATGRVFFGIRFVVGVAAEFTTIPLEVFVEAAPVLGVTPVLRADVDAGAGVRYFF